MASALLILVLLALIASLGSWLFSQWSSKQRRASALAVGLGGTGLLILLGATATAVICISLGWRQWLPGFDSAAPKLRTAGPPVAVAALGTAADWPATACIKPLQAPNTVPRRWFLDNDCEQPVVVMLAWCDESRSVCTAGAPQAAWHYEAAGVIMTNPLARPIARRMPEHGAPITGTYALTEPEGSVLRLRYLACYLAEPAAAALADEATGSEEFQHMLRADQCYSRVSSASQAAARSGQPPVLSLQ
jgi:hypothetical protein